VTLGGIRPPIWRRLVVPASIELAQLHRVIQAAMGWFGGHLHAFITAMDEYGPPNPFGGEELFTDYTGMPLHIVMQEPGHRIRYDYDFGDGWEHEILLEKVLPEKVDRVSCLKGKRACPPEDVGGVPGYYMLLDAIKHPDRPDSEDYLEWNGDFDPEEFSVERVNQRLARLA
jgi:hypothetical protein